MLPKPMIELKYAWDSIKRGQNNMRSHIWCYALDFFNTIFYVPFTIFPAVATCTLGVLDFLPPVASTMFSWAMFNQLLGMCGMSIIVSSVYRLAALHNATDAMTSRKTIFITVLAHIFYTVPCITVYLTTMHSEEEMLDYMKNTHPKLLPFWNAHKCAIFISLSDLMRYALVAMAQIFLAAAATLTIIWYCFREMKRTRSIISSKTYRLHKMLSISLLLQFIMIGMIQPYRIVFFKYFWSFRRMIGPTSKLPNTTKVSSQPKCYCFVSAVRSQSVRSQRARSQSVVINM
ncbi:serpentine type 7TM GPCR chemoreceptor srh domain-containing protein [Ditylenchus destructor]|nr:serpentine type 7TM GPCR chemoreceptor srh domain-containing protein [Ditylenchus destructor]